MIILGIETSCDETGVAIVEQNPNSSLSIHSNIVASSLKKHAETGGIIPEIAAREQIKAMAPVLSEALLKGIGYHLGENTSPAIDAIAVTYGPGLIGSLLVGVETAKTLSSIWNKPLIPVNHMHGHLYANWLENSDIVLPAVVLIVSGGHTDLLLLNEKKEITIIGGTRDDAAGEAFDKIGRLLNLPYPAGPRISQLAEQGNATNYPLPRPMIGSKDYEFSFSGLKTAVLNLVKKNNWDFSQVESSSKLQQIQYDLSASVQKAIIEVLVRKTVSAAIHHNVKSVLLGGGVAANSLLKKRLLEELSEKSIALTSPSPELCTDNGAMIAAAAFFSPPVDRHLVKAEPGLYY